MDILQLLDEAETKAGGRKALARALNARYETVCQWRYRESVPQRWLPALERTTGIPIHQWVAANSRAA